MRDRVVYYRGNIDDLEYREIVRMSERLFEEGGPDYVQVSVSPFRNVYLSREPRGDNSFLQFALFLFGLTVALVDFALIRIMFF